jgi:DNA polymerase-3 subunit epsilon
MAPLLCPQANIREAGLDEWIDWFKLEVFERHNASADALATAELALILFSRARQQQIHSPLNLQQRLNQWKRRQHTVLLIFGLCSGLIAPTRLCTIPVGAWLARDKR